MPAKSEDTKNFNSSKEILFNNSIQALTECGFVIKFENKESGRILAKAKFSFWSFAEDLTLQIQDNGNVTMKSECSMPTQIIDWGKNKRNVRKFFLKLSDNKNT